MDAAGTCAMQKDKKERQPLVCQNDASRNSQEMHHVINQTPSLALIQPAEKLFFH